MWIYYVILVYYNKFSQTWIEEAFILLAMQWLSSDGSAASGILCPPVKVSLNRTVNPTLCSLWQRDTCKSKTFPQSKPTRAPQTLVRSTWLIPAELKKESRPCSNKASLEGSRYCTMEMRPRIYFPCSCSMIIIRPCLSRKHSMARWPASLKCCFSVLPGATKAPVPGPPQCRTFQCFLSLSTAQFHVEPTACCLSQGLPEETAMHQSWTGLLLINFSSLRNKIQRNHLKQK